MIGDEVEASHNTTPDVVDLQRTLCRMADAGCDYVVMEVSSHALALNRVAGIEYDTAALTNITQDHLDFHKTMENYREAKALLFTHLHEAAKRERRHLHMDDASSPLIMNRVKTKVMTYGKARTNDVYPIRFHVGAKHMELSLHTPEGNMDLRLHITGEFNVYNVMTAVCAALAEGLKHDDIVRGLDNFAGVPGRFQLIDAGQPFTVIVDYAHTPDGLDNVLRTARQITKADCGPSSAAAVTGMPKSVPSWESWLWSLLISLLLRATTRAVKIRTPSFAISRRVFQTIRSIKKSILFPIVGKQFNLLSPMHARKML